MIIYFSATGNCKYTAENLAVKGEQIISIADAMKTDTLDYQIPDGDNLGLISPVYEWGLPTIVAEFLEKVRLRFNNKPYTYLVVTYGTTTGQCGYYANQFVEKKGLPFDGRFSIRFPDTWTPIYDLSNKEKVKEQLENAKTELDMVKGQMVRRELGDFLAMKIPRVATSVAQYLYKNETRKTKYFRVEDTCIGCGMCEKKCPVKAIQMKDGKPRWIMDKCVMCLGCLHRCPKFSIQYKNKTKLHGQYINPNVKI